jgi:hypothetical protein
MELEHIGYIWIASIIIGLIIGAKKGMGCLSLIGCVILGPIGVIIVILTKGYKVKCRQCSKTISRKAVVCPYCNNSQEVYPD